MKPIRFAAVALNQTPLDWSGNLSRIEAALSEARSQNASVVCLPELAITGYGCEDMFLSPGVCERALEQLVALLPSTVTLSAQQLPPTLPISSTTSPSLNSP